MDISKKFYRELTPRQRAIACYSAINRNDQSEMDRLMGTASRDSGVYKALRGLGQALEAYNLLVSKAVIGLLLASGQSKEASSFCSGWLSAGGLTDNKEYLKKFLAAKALSTVCDYWLDEIAEVQQVVLEWCEKNQVSADFFSGPLCHLPLPREVEKQSDSETLQAVRSMFEKITLAW